MWATFYATILSDASSILPMQSLELLVFTPTIKNVLIKYMDGMTSVPLCSCGIFLYLTQMTCSNTYAKHDDIAKSTGAEVVNALGRTDVSNLIASFRRDLSFSTPPLTLYRNYRPGEYPNLIFGVPLVDLRMNEDKVPKVMRICIEEVEKRGLHIEKIYAVSLLSRYVQFFESTLKCRSRISHMAQKYGRPVEYTVLTNLLADMSAIQLLHRLETEKSFSFTSTDNIHSVATLLKVSYCNHSKYVDSLSLFLALPLRSSRTSVCALFERILPLRTE